MGWHHEGDQLEATIAQTTKATAGSVDDTVGVARVASLLIALADHLLWDLNEPIDDVAQGSTELPSRRVGRPWRCLNIGEYGAAEDYEATSNNEEFFHAAKRLMDRMRNWQREFKRFDVFFRVQSSAPE
jgi:hypothetical protein